jgi:Rieske Fe-S protein
MALRAPSEREPLWREEFSVHAEDERLVTRRQFAKFLTLTSIAMVAGNLWILAKSWLYRPAALPPLRVATVGEVPIGGVKLFNYPTANDPCLMIRTDADTYVAYSQVCTHLSCAVYFSAATNRIECPCHKGAFAVKDGAVISGPPSRALPRVALEQRGRELVATNVRVS